MQHNTYERRGLRPRAGDHQASGGRTGLAVLEDMHDDRQILIDRLNSEEFEVLTPKSKQDCLHFLRQGCRLFILDVDMGPGREREGLHTLEELKAECPECFCAIVSGDVRSREQARILGADWIGGKAPEDIEHLIQVLDDVVYVMRRLELTDGLSIHKIAVRLRKLDKRHELTEISGDLTAILSRVRSRFEDVEERLRQRDTPGIAQKLVLIEADMRQLTAAGLPFGDGFGIPARALKNAIVQQFGQELTAEQWQTWKTVFEEVGKRANELSTDEGIELADELDRAGFNTEPPQWPSIAEILNSGEDNGWEDTHSVGRPIA
jgi:hypothetical protein